MSAEEKLNVDISLVAKNRDNDPDGFSAEMDIRYKNMSRLIFATLESDLMGMFKGLADKEVAVRLDEQKVKNQAATA